MAVFLKEIPSSKAWVILLIRKVAVVFSAVSPTAA